MKEVLGLISGLCLFLFGMNIMSEALERKAGSKLRTILVKLTSNKFTGFLTGMVVTAIIQGTTVSAASGVYGILMHIIATSALVITAGLIYKYNKTRKGAIIALICGVIAMTVVMIGANMVVTPIFMGVPASVVWQLMPFIAGFNAIKAGINGLVTFLVYKRISGFLHKQ